MMDEADVQRVLGFPHTMIGSDGLPHDFHPHPRLWGTFPRVLGHYCRELRLFGLEEAVRKMTSLPAARFSLSGRSMVAAGAYADITVFDPATVIDRATFERPITPAAGIEHVFVNGRPVWIEGKPTGDRPGRALRRRQLQAQAPLVGRHAGQARGGRGRPRYSPRRLAASSTMDRSAYFLTSRSERKKPSLCARSTLACSASRFGSARGSR